MKSSWKTHRGKPFFYADYASFGEDLAALMAEVDAADGIVCQQAENSIVVLVDVRGTVGTPEAMGFIKKSAARTRKHIRKMAVLGIYGIRQMLFEIVAHFSGQNMVAFDDAEKAMDWLVED
jgi:hypothetical protein